MNEELGISEESYNYLLSHVGLKSIYGFYKEHSGGQLGVFNFIDNYGRFVPDNTPYKKIAKVIFDNLSSKDKMRILEYIEASEEGEFE